MKDSKRFHGQKLYESEKCVRFAKKTYELKATDQQQHENNTNEQLEHIPTTVFRTSPATDVLVFSAQQAADA